VSCRIRDDRLDPNIGEINRLTINSRHVGYHATARDLEGIRPDRLD
jgi:hypothetical protein